MPEGALAEFRSAGAILAGHFRLTSGLHSDTYLQCALVMSDPTRAARVLAPLAERWRGKGITLVAGPAVGGIAVAYEMARLLGVRTVYSERENGAMRLRRGFRVDPGDVALLVEDVITTGGSLLEIRKIVEESGARVAGIASLVDRMEKPWQGLDVPFHAALKLSPPTYAPDACPLCRQGLPIDTPGSRHLQGKAR